EDISLFRENVAAAQESGVRFITLHPRTKVDGYGPPARWDLIAEAKSLLTIPLVGNGDILTVEDALKMLKQTHCDALMIGRGAVINPFLFHQIRAHFSRKPYQPKWEELAHYIEVFVSEIPPEMPARNRINKLKQHMNFLFKGNPALLEKRDLILTTSYADQASFLSFVMPLLQNCWQNDKKMI
ncbi:MAG TPA: tRNA-dihydrouridine synthase family protein, partial [Chlamydiales bacterium]|nr:tRNA-dihydrouridine synthase family protein [Chlamydiales bacterium]